MSENVPGFQALPGATPENSAFIDLYFNPSVSLPGKSTVSIEINDWQLRPRGWWVSSSTVPWPF